MACHSSWTAEDVITKHPPISHTHQHLLVLLQDIWGSRGGQVWAGQPQPAGTIRTGTCDINEWAVMVNAVCLSSVVVFFSRLFDGGCRHKHKFEPTCCHDNLNSPVVPAVGWTQLMCGTFPLATQLCGALPPNTAASINDHHHLSVFLIITFITQRLPPLNLTFSLWLEFLFGLQLSVMSFRTFGW